MAVTAFVVEMTRALAWPLSTLLLAFFFRGQLGTLLARLVHLKGPGGVEAAFGSELDKVEKSRSAESRNDGDLRLAIVDKIDFNLPPSYLIIDAWKKIEEKLQSLAVSRGLHDGRGTLREPLLIARRLPLPPERLEAIKGLKSIRYEVTNSSDGRTPTTTDALRFIQLAKEILEVLTQVTPDQDLPYPLPGRPL
jgi:hypothetical protein